MRLRTAKRRNRIIFITGTDTGVGKTVFTGLLLYHLRQMHIRALAIKPFCSGGRDDVELLHALQDGELSEEQINPSFFAEPVAPLIAARKHRRRIALKEVVQHIKKTALKCEVLLVEGAGGLLAPLGENYCLGEIIERLKCEVVVVAKNRLGTINHTRLTVRALRDFGVRNIDVVLMSGEENEKADPSIRTNAKLLREILAPTQVHEVEFLGRNANKIAGFKNTYKKVKKTLARYWR